MDLAAVLGFLIIALLHKSQATHFQFFFENEIMFDKCPDVPDNNGIHDLCDISEYQIEFIDGSIIVQGNATVVWDVLPEDRIEVSGQNLVPRFLEKKNIPNFFLVTL